jgi:hypothetical protein
MVGLSKMDAPNLGGGTGMPIVIVYLLFPRINQPVFPSLGGLIIRKDDLQEMTVP